MNRMFDWNFPRPSSTFSFFHTRLGKSIMIIGGIAKVYVVLSFPSSSLYYRFLWLRIHHMVKWKKKLCWLKLTFRVRRKMNDDGWDMVRWWWCGEWEESTMVAMREMEEFELTMNLLRSKGTVNFEDWQKYERESIVRSTRSGEEVMTNQIPFFLFFILDIGEQSWS